jgi:hypothetical protein
MLPHSDGVFCLNGDFEEVAMFTVVLLTFLFAAFMGWLSAVHPAMAGVFILISLFLWAAAVWDAILRRG